MAETRRILVFGSSNTGKTSMLNTLCDQNEPVSSEATGCTFKTVPFKPFTRNNIIYQFYDTAGLNEADAGTITTTQALQNILSLLKHSKHGFNLLIFVIRIGTILQAEKLTYDIFVNVLTQHQIPVLCVITGCENEQPMADYAARNKDHYEKQDMIFTDIVSTCFAKGGPMENYYRDLRQQSYEAVWQMIVWYASQKPIVFLTDENSLIAAFKRVWNYFCDWLKKPTWRWTGINDQIDGTLERMGIRDGGLRNEFIQTVQNSVLRENVRI
jgi:GTPase Era involved in 16S rRNA processing